MRDLANFIGELGGESWDAQAVAVVVAAILALTAAVLTAIVAIKQGQANREAAARQIADVIKKDRDLALESAAKDRQLAAQTGERERELKARDQWWQRFKSVSDDLTTSEGLKKDVALVLMRELADSPWATKKDKLMIDAVLAELTRIALRSLADRSEQNVKERA